MTELIQLEQRLNDHIEHCDARFEEGRKQLDELLTSTQRSTDAVNRLTSETAEFVELYRDMKGVVRIGVIVQKAGLWVIKWPLIGTGIYAIYKWFTSELG